MIKLINYILKSKLEFFFPKKCKVLVYDNVNFQYFKNFLQTKDFAIFYTRKEILNLPIILISIFKHGMNNLNSSYKLEYIKFSNPKFIITMIDNDIDFLSFKFKHTKKIAIQNAYRRTAFPDVFSGLKFSSKNDYNLDVAFCFNRSIAKIYNKYLKCKTIIVGSIKNNKIKKIKNKKNTLAYISQFRPIATSEKKKFIFPYSEFKRKFDLNKLNKKKFRNITIFDFYKNDEEVLNLILKYLKNKNISLDIIGVMKKDQFKEKEYFKKICKNHKFNFIPNNYDDMSYKVLDNYKNIIGIDSTMLYDALARGRKVGFFSVRETSFIGHQVYFGYPYNNKPIGVCWTNRKNFNEVKRILDYLLNSSFSNYKRDMKDYIFNLTYYDNNNSKFSRELKKIISQ